MILLVVLVAVIAGVGIAAGLPWPVAIVFGLVVPLAGSQLYLRITHQNAPTRTLSPRDPRTRRFLVVLMARYRARGYEHGATTLAEVLKAYDAGDVEDASARFGRLSSSVAHSPSATQLISIWQGAWRDSRNADAGAQYERPPVTNPDRPVAARDSREATDRQESSERTPWSTQNAERDAGLLLRAVLRSMLVPDVPASAKPYAEAIGQCVKEQNEKSLLLLLTGVMTFVATVHFRQDDPMHDPRFVPYMRLLAAHFMNAAAQALPGPPGPTSEMRGANAARLAADTSPASGALLEALAIVGASAVGSLTPVTTAAYEA